MAYSYQPLQGAYELSATTQNPSNRQPTVTMAPHAPPMSNDVFFERVGDVRADISSLAAQISIVAKVHQRLMSSPDQNGATDLDTITTSTQTLTTHIRDAIRTLEIDCRRGGRNTAGKESQIRSLKSSFSTQLEYYRKVEAEYARRYRDQLKRQYRIVNPTASDAELDEAADTDWGNEGVFQTALKTNRTDQAGSALGAVRARHRNIQHIERTLAQLNQLFADLADAVVMQEPAVLAAEEQTARVKTDTEAANVHLGKGVESARNARKLKWWGLGIALLILLVVGLAVGLTVNKSLS